MSGAGPLAQLPVPLSAMPVVSPVCTEGSPAGIVVRHAAPPPDPPIPPPDPPAPPAPPLDDELDDDELLDDEDDELLLDDEDELLDDETAPPPPPTPTVVSPCAHAATPAAPNASSAHLDHALRIIQAFRDRKRSR